MVGVLVSRRGMALALPALAATGWSSPVVADRPDGPTVDSVRRLDPAGRLVVHVRLNGQGPYTFLVDTGANASVISSDLAATLNLPSGAPVNLHSIAGVERVQSVSIDNVSVGSRERRNMQMSVIAGRHLKAQGVLGMDWMGSQGLTLDFAEKEMRIGASAPGAEQRSVSVPVRTRRSGLSLIDARIGSARALTFLDTGSTTTVGNMALMRMAVAQGQTGRDLTEIELTSLTGQTLAGRLVILDSLTLGKMMLRHVPVVFGPVHTFEYWGLADEPALLIGVDVLRAFKSVTLDYHRKAVHFILPTGSADRDTAAS
jgi:predicted aspartyl protease